MRALSPTSAAQAVRSTARHLARRLTRRKSELFEQTLLSAARSAAIRGDHRVILPTDRSERKRDALRIGFFDNLANQAFISARVLRRLGYEADVVLQENFIDRFVLAQPLWEDAEFEGVNAWEPLVPPVGWAPPSFVRSVRYDVNLERKFARRLSAVDKVIDLYKASFGTTLPRDLALLLAQNMGHWDYIKAMHDYDVVVLSMGATKLAPFCQRPTVICPLGGDLYIRAFEEDVDGLLFRAGFRGAKQIAIAETDYDEYLDRLGVAADRTFMPLLVDTDIYHDNPEPDLRRKWQEQVGGSVFLFGTCRQSWEWKGTDRLIEGFAAFRRAHPEASDWRLILQAWGDDLDRSRALVQSFGLDQSTIWMSMCSKGLLRQRQRAADIACDQFVMEGYGASVLEAMAAGKPVIISPVPEASKHRFRTEPPPFVGARTAHEIAAALARLLDPDVRRKIGKASRAWVENEHGYRALAPSYVEMLERAAEVHGDVPSATRRSFTAALKEAHSNARADLKMRWNRVLPMGDVFVDRWEKARFLGFGEGASIYDSAVVIGDVKVGEKTWIGPNCILDGSGGLSIGSTCSISAGVQIYSHNTVDWAVSGGVSSYHRQAIEIADRVYIGPGAIIAGGSRIGARSIIGALSFVNGEIPPGSFAVGTPARVVGHVNVARDGSVSIARSDK
jgi:acetyltransferase-like isoleucine patch superfamily enzyme/glycosyltransferase involved in cell wall biosynthesis